MNDETIFKRVSCRDFLDKEVENEKMRELPGAICLAKSACGTKLGDRTT